MTPTNLLRSSFILISLLATACTHGGQAGGTVLVQDAARGVAVSGEGEAEGRPDRATFNVGVEARRDTIAEARQAGATIQTQILAALRAQGVEQAYLRTTQLSLQPEYDYSEEGRRLLGYTARNQVAVTVVDLEKLSGTIDAAIGAGGEDVRLEGIAFEVSDPESLRQRAREEAMAQAKAKAEQLARLGGVELGQPIAITETTFDDGGGRPMMMEARASDAAAMASTPIEPGETKIRVVVEVRYELR